MILRWAGRVTYVTPLAWMKSTDWWLWTKENGRRCMVVSFHILTSISLKHLFLCTLKLKLKNQTFRSQWTLSIDDWIEHCYVYERNIDYKNGFGKWQNNSSEHHHPWNKLKNGPISTETFFIFILTTVLPAFRSYFSFKVTLQYLQDKLICNGILRDDKGVVHEWNPLQSL